MSNELFGWETGLKIATVIGGAVIIRSTVRFLSNLMHKNLKELCGEKSCQADWDYVVKNVCKAVALSAMSLPGAYALGRGIVTKEWNTELVQSLGIMYAQFDIAGMMLMAGTPRMTRTTTAHHCVVTAFVFANICTDYQEPTMMRCAVIAGVMSCFSFGANIYVALRRGMGMLPLYTIHAVEDDLRTLASASSYIYIASLVASVSMIVWTAKDMTHLVVQQAAFFALFALILLDDVLFVSFLRKMARKKAIDTTKKPDEINYLLDITQ